MRKLATELALRWSKVYKTLELHAQRSHTRDVKRAVVIELVRRRIRFTGPRWWQRCTKSACGNVQKDTAFWYMHARASWTAGSCVL